jgi:tetratricopeptide (TPR) repeat protein
MPRRRERGIVALPEDRMRIAAAIALFVCSALQAQQFVYPRPDPSKFTVVRNVEYESGRAFDLYRPAGSAVVPVVITCNVGNPGMKDWPGYVGWGEATAGAGLAAVHYNAGPDPVASFDALMAALRKRSAEYGIDPDRVVVWGGSSNVRLALPLAMDPKRDYIRGAVIYYGDAEVGPILTQRPVFFVRAGLDQPGLNARVDALLQKAIQANAPWTIENYGGGLHGFDIFNDNDVSRDVIRRTLGFMAAVTDVKLSRAYVAAADDAALGAAFARREWAVAAEGYARRIAANPSDGESHLRLGHALHATGKYAEALQHFERAWSLGRQGPRDTALPAARAAAKGGNLERTAHWLGVVLRTPFVTLDDVRRDEALGPVLETPEIRALVTWISEQNEIVALFRTDRPAALERLRTSTSPHLRNEATLNIIGYRLLNGGATAAAVDVFQFAVESYPQSANAWESLSEAQEAAGQKAEALQSARKALSLNGPEPVRAAAQARVERLK